MRDYRWGRRTETPSDMRRTARTTKGIIMINGRKFMAAVLRGLEVSGMDALAQAGYSESTLNAIESIEKR